MFMELLEAASREHAQERLPYVRAFNLIGLDALDSLLCTLIEQNENVETKMWNKANNFLLGVLKKEDSSMKKLYWLN